MGPKSKSDRYIVLAKEMGYSATESGEILGPKGNAIVGQVAKSGHLRFRPAVGDRKDRLSVLCHRFVAFCFFGPEIFSHEVVRHVNDVPSDNRIENLAMGSRKDNRADIPKWKLTRIAKANAHLLVQRSRKLSDSDVQTMRLLRSIHKTAYKTLGEQFGVAAMTAHRACSKQSWGDVA